MLRASMAGCFCLSLFSSRRSRLRGKLQRRTVTIPIRPLPASADDGSNWAALPPDILRSVATRLNIPEQVRLRVVCTSWFHATEDSHPFIRDAAPWLMLNHYDDKSELSLVRPLDGQRFRLPLLRQATGNVWCVGYKDGWIVVLHNLKILLLNPITRAQFPFPSFYAQPGVDHNIDPCVEKVILSDTPTTSPDSVITAMAVASSGNVAYARSTDRKWTQVPVTDESSVRDIAYHFGVFCILCSGPLSTDFVGRYRQSQLTMVSFRGSTHDSIQYEYRDPLEEGSISLASSPTGKLLLVLGVQDPDSKKFTEFSVMAWGGLGTYWTPVVDLGDRSLFVDSLQTSLLPTTDGAGLEANCVYLARIVLGATNELVMDTGMFDLRSGAKGPCFHGSWHIEQMSSVFPFWFTPSLT